MNKFIELIKYIIIGIIQGITEIFPISSSGHLYIAYEFLNISNQQQLNLTIFLHFASSLALCIHFKDLIIKILKGFIFFIFKKDEKHKEGFMLGIYLILSSIPSAIVGFFIKPLVESYFSNISIICLNFILTSIILLLSSLIKNNKLNFYTLKNTLITGLFQCLAMFPGISRSCITMFGGKLAKLNDKKAKEFTFLLLIPISLGSTLLSFKEMNNLIVNNSTIYLYIISFLVSFIFTLLALKILFSKSIKIKNYYYSIYLLIISLLLLFRIKKS